MRNGKCGRLKIIILIATNDTRGGSDLSALWGWLQLVRIGGGKLDQQTLIK